MIGFDATHTNLASLQPIAYARQRPGVDSGASNVGKALLVKSQIWKAEKEWRLTARLAKCEVKMINGAPIYIQRLDRGCYTSITFGCRADDAFVAAVGYSLKAWGMEHCQLRRLYLCDKTYSLKVREKTAGEISQLS